MPFLTMQGITKRFPGVVANDQVDLDVARGEIHALVGENGAGKSTLMKILYGLEQPDSGQITLEGAPIVVPNPQAAIRLGIGMVHQHFQLVPSLTVAENVALGHEIRSGLFVKREAMNERVAELSRTFGLKVEPRARVADLSVGVRQRVEILKLLYCDARLLILDEPTAVLTPQEVDGLFEVIQRLVSEGRTAIFITHKLHEVKTICARATVLRRGKVIGTVNVADTTPRQIAQMMVGAEVEDVRRTPEHQVGATLLEVQGVSADDDRSLPALKDVSFTVCGGEIVGVVGVEGNGQHELLEVLIGLRRLKGGQIRIDGRDCTQVSARARRGMGMGLIPEDRNAEGLSKDLTIWENLIATRYHTAAQSTYGVLKLGTIAEEAADLMRTFDVRAVDADVTVGTLSGGNAQKIVIARELAGSPRVLIAAQPTRGLDIGAAHFVHEQLLRLRGQGIGILLISTDLDELMAVCDRFVVLFEGRIIGAVDAGEVSREGLGLLMAGHALSEEARA